MITIPVNQHLPNPKAPAFPVPPSSNYTLVGISTRTYLAAHAPPIPNEFFDLARETDWSIERKHADWAVSYADALIDRLNQP